MPRCPPAGRGRPRPRRPRPSCSPAERALGEQLAADWATFADEVRREPFRCHPDAFLGFIAPACIASIAAAVLLVGLWPAPLVDMMNTSIEQLIQQISQSKL